MMKNWDCTLCHVWREGNRSADRLARWSHELEPGLLILDEVPQTVKEILNEDVQGVSLPRLISM